MTDKELERLERLAAQLMAGTASNPNADNVQREFLAQEAVLRAQELIKQIDALKIAE